MTRRQATITLASVIGMLALACAIGGQPERGRGRDMRLFGKVDSTVDRLDRPLHFGGPFDIEWDAPVEEDIIAGNPDVWTDVIVLGPDDDTLRLTIRLTKDGQAAQYRQAVRVFIADEVGGLQTAEPADSVTVWNGQILETHTANEDYTLITNSDGQILLDAAWPGVDVVKTFAVIHNGRISYTALYNTRGAP